MARLGHRTDCRGTDWHGDGWRGTALAWHGLAWFRHSTGLARHGVAYLLSIRLNPIIPYWPVNLAIGCTTMPMREFFWLTLIGLAPSIFVYCLAGTHLGELGHMGEAASWEVAAAMLGLSLVPLAFDRLVLKRRK